MSSSRTYVVTKFVRMSVCMSCFFSCDEQLKKWRCHSVRPYVCPFFSFSVLGVCSAFFLVLKCFNRVSRKFKGCLNFLGSFKEVSRMFQEILKGVYRKFQGSSKDNSRKFKRCFKDILGKFHGCFNNLWREFQRCFKGFWRKCQLCLKKKVTRMFQECFNEVLFCNFFVVLHSSHLPEQKEGLFFSLLDVSASQ